MASIKRIASMLPSGTVTFTGGGGVLGAMVTFIGALDAGAFEAMLLFDELLATGTLLLGVTGSS